MAEHFQADQFARRQCGQRVRLVVNLPNSASSFTASNRLSPRARKTWSSVLAANSVVAIFGLIECQS